MFEKLRAFIIAIILSVSFGMEFDAPQASPSAGETVEVEESLGYFLGKQPRARTGRVSATGDG